MLHREMLIGGYFIGGPCDQAIGKTVIHNPFNGRVVGTAAEGGEPEASAAVEAAAEAFKTWRGSTREERQRLLRRIAALVRERAEELIEILTDEVGKPVVWSRGEVTRLALTFDLAAELCTSYGLETLPVDYDPRGRGYVCRAERFPIGPILCIVPYNWPYNLTAHKVAPALAAGNTVVVKPSSQAPLSTLSLVRLIHEAGCPPGVVNAVVCEPKHAEAMARDPRIKMLSFTGSPQVGWHLKEILHDKRVALELGGNAFAYVAADADLDWAAQRIVPGAFGYAGQICISVQHVLCDEQVYRQLREKLVQGTQSCRFGDPRDEQVVCGPLISEGAADRVESWIAEAKEAGATLLAGGGREGNVIPPTLLENVPKDVRLSCDEVFGPVLTLEPVAGLDEAFARIDSSQYGIQAGVFTRDLRVAERAYRELEVGGVIVDDYPTLRFDNMPYGGVKRSGFGREGVRYALDEMTEWKTLVVRTSG
jgi:acyl-CoA reductase-like NAD-dependent aldehyde dehydrogenase